MPRFRTHARLPAFCFCILVVLAVIASPGLAAAAPADALPSQGEIHQLFEQKQYPLVLQKIARVLTLKADAAKEYDRHDLVRLTAETYLRLKAYGPAERAFSAAAGETDDRTPAAIDLATSVLVHRSKTGQYQPTQR